MCNQPQKRIVRFLKKHHIMTLATSAGNMPWCANCFYVYMEDKNCFIFTSDNETKHIRDTVKNPYVAGSVVLETKNIGKIQGVQFTGEVKLPGKILLPEIKKIFIKRFPYTIFGNINLWILEINYLKMTDNRLGFGKKLIWQKSSD